MPLHYFPAARNDITEALAWSAVNFGAAAGKRYQKVLSVAITEIAANPELTHSQQLPGLQPGIRLYHLKHSRARAAVQGQIVRKPRHFIAYKLIGDDVVIVRVLHERMEISRQLEDPP
jgi:toxin ParE1/3/4